MYKVTCVCVEYVYEEHGRTLNRYSGTGRCQCSTHCVLCCAKPPIQLLLHETCSSLVQFMHLFMLVAILSSWTIHTTTPFKHTSFLDKTFSFLKWSPRQPGCMATTMYSSILHTCYCTCMFQYYVCMYSCHSITFCLHRRPPLFLILQLVLGVIAP